MKLVNVSGLKNNPTEALRNARTAPALVMNRDKPDALIVGVESAGGLEGPGVRVALATALFRDGHLSLARSARLASIPMQDFVAHLSRLAIPVIELDAKEVHRDMDTLEEWLASS